MTTQQLQADEADCLNRFRARAAKLRAANPTLSRDMAFARAVEAMPKSATRYQYARARLQLAGIPALDLFE